MKNNFFEFFIEDYCADISDDLSFLPPLTTRRLSELDKIAFSTLYKCFKKGTNPNLVFASRYGQFDRLSKLTKQFLADNEVSPMAFSGSVHNNTIGLFSILNGITASYNSVSACENTVSSGLLEAVLQLKISDEVLFCYADYFNNNSKSVSLLLRKKSDNGVKIKCIFDKNNSVEKDEYESLCAFLDGRNECFKPKLFSFERVIND